MKSTIFACIITKVLLLISGDAYVTRPILNVNKSGLFVTECTTLEGNWGYCVQSNRCKTLIHLQNSDPKNWTCGPSNQLKSNPLICCDIEKINATESEPFARLLQTTKKCGVQSVETPVLSTRILGGEETYPGEFPWLVKIFRKSRFQGIDTFGCTGSLITSRVVLTTAHCIKSHALDDFGPVNSVLLGEHGKNLCVSPDCSFKPQRVNISKLILHPNYIVDDKSFGFDIGLIELKEEAKFSNYIGTICLLERAYEAEEYFLGGWGSTENDNISPVKLKTSVAPYSWKQCAQKFKGISVSLSSNQICAGGVKNKDSCKGDSGGPLMVVINGKWFAAGLVSFGVSCGAQDWPAVYSYVPSHLGWIRNEVEKLE